MLKRFTCLILSLVLLVCLIPAAAVQVSAASNTTSDAAITILKKLEGFTSYCFEKKGAYEEGTVYGKVWYTGYGTKCTETGTHGYYVQDVSSGELEHIHNDDLFDKMFETKVENGVCVIKRFKLAKSVTKFEGYHKDWSVGDYVWHRGDKELAKIKTVLEDPNVTMEKIEEAMKFAMLDSDVQTALTSNTTLKYLVTKFWDQAITDTNDCIFTTTPLTVKQEKVYYHTIRENEADKALREEVKKLDSAINGFASNKGIALTQNQHDALVLFSFQNGTGWTKGTDDLQNAVVNGTTGQAFVDVMLNWRRDNDNDRRKVEANMYLYNVYSSNPAALVVTNGTSNDSDLVTDDQVTVTVTNAYINVRSKASIYGTPVGKVYYGDTLHILRASVQDANGYRWGKALNEKYQEIGYIALKYTNYDGVLAAAEYEGQASGTSKKIGTAMVYVNGYVNVRSGAGTKNPIISSLRNGVNVEIYDVEYVNGQRWGLTSTGWFNLKYTKNLSLDTTKVNTNTYGYQNFVFTLSGHTTEIKLENISTDPANPTYINAATFVSNVEMTTRVAPGISSARKDTLAVGTEFDVKQVVADGDTVWGYTKDPLNKYEGWVDLSTQYCKRLGVSVTDSSDPTAYALVGEVVNCVEVHVRNKASVYGAEITKLPAGTIVEVLYGPENGNANTGWYAVGVPNSYGTDSFIRGDYLSVRDGTKGEITYGKTSSSMTSPDGSKAATGRGMVANTPSGVNVRTAPGTANAKVTKLVPGTVVDILEVTMYGSTKWGRIEQGWVCMDYIAMVDYDDLDSANTVISSNQVIYEGKVSRDVNDDGEPIYVYKEADRTSETVRAVGTGTTVTIHELMTVNEVTYDDGTTTHTTKTYWARVNDGYIPEPELNIKLDALYEQVYTVTGTDLLKVREWPGTSSAREDLDLAKGDQVKITNLEIVGDQIWGMFENDELGADGVGWIALSYCTKGAIATSDPGEGETGIPTPVTPVSLSIGNTGKQTYAGKIIGSAQVQEVNVRKEPATNAAEVTTLKKGTAITITETTLVDGRSWGYCGSGWINLLYVDLTPVGITAIDAKIIAVDNTLCYDSSETGANVVGSYANRAVVHIYEEMNGMYKTDMGWVAKNNFLN